MRACGAMLLVVTACFDGPATVPGSDESTSASASTSAESGSSSLGTQTSTTAMGTNESSSAASADGTTAAECGDARVVPPFSPPWSGPIVLRAGEPLQPPPPCPDGWAPTAPPVVDATAPEQCACGCIEPPEERCSITIRYGQNLNCSDAQFFADAPCEAMPGEALAIGPTITAAACTAIAGAVPVEGQGPTMLCVPTEPPADPGCLEVPVDGRGPCIYVEGPMMCPEGWDDAIAAKHLSCGACACPPLDLYCADLELALHATDDCSESPVQTVGDGGCAQSPGVPVSLRAAELVEPTPYVCTSTVEAHTDVTICCA